MAKTQERKQTRKTAGKSKTRRAVAIDRFGGVDELKLRELPMPEPGYGKTPFGIRTLRTSLQGTGLLEENKVGPGMRSAE
jgi:hypothetical protein